MKKIIFYILFLLLNPVTGYTQDIINITGSASNDAVQQIRLQGMDDLPNLQQSNQSIVNSVVIQQSGNLNSANISQQHGSSSEVSNQSYTVQSGNLNELTLGQIGNKNLMMGFQSNNMYALTSFVQANLTRILTGNIGITEMQALDANGNTVEAERNKMTISQNGNNNGLVAVQQGSDNTISAEQTGNNNYLLALQKGNNNSLTGYKQENESAHDLVDKVIQIGDNLSVKSEEVSKSSIIGNTFMQTGTNLSMVISSDLINSPGGMEVKQTGKDMKVVIDQSYFSFPLK